jgi:biopolymer transport protein ExbD
MAEKRRFLDVWILDSNTVYREVPFTAVIDWIQQGRLLGDDMLRWSGQKDWFKLGGVPAFTAYLPRADTNRIEDQAEALERVELDFSFKRPQPDEDEDVDMIPLIDVSLVLLIFFIMTATSTAAAIIMMPFANNFITAKDPSMYWIGINYRGQDGNRDAAYSLGSGTTVFGHYPSIGDLVSGLRERLAASQQRSVTVEIKAHQDLPEGIVGDLLTSLTALNLNEEVRAKIAKMYVGVR